MTGQYVYHYTQGEANFGPPISEEVERGAHLTFDIVTHIGTVIYGLRRPDGLHDGPKNGLYFPHGLIRFGETLETCVNRIVKDQAGAMVQAARPYSFSSWVEDNHWHMCLNVLAELHAPPVTSNEVSEVVETHLDSIQDDYPWWTKDQLTDIITYLARQRGD